jgi:hypothetical protein
VSRRSIASLFVLAVVAAGVVGCGSSDDESSDGTVTTSSLTKAEYVEKVDEICAAGKRTMTLAFAKYAAEHGSPSNLVEPKLAPGILTVLVPAIHVQDEEIEELGAPEGDEAEIEAFIAARERIVAKAEKNPPKTIFQFGDAFRHSPNKLAAKYGLRACIY